MLLLYYYVYQVKVSKVLYFTNTLKDENKRFTHLTHTNLEKGSRNIKMRRYAPITHIMSS